MTCRPSPKYASKSPGAGPWATCQRCGLIDNLPNLQWQYDFRGGSVPQKVGFLFCKRCLDGLAYQRKLIVLPPDPPPVFNALPEPYLVDESSWLSTQDGDIIETQNDELILQNLPDTDLPGNISYLVSVISGGSVAVAYLDLFDGDPSAGGVSVLVDITGSSTRTNVASQLTSTVSEATNAYEISVAASSAATVNVTYVGIYDTATGGTLLMSGACSASPSIAAGNPVVFAPLGLTVTF